MIIITLAFPLDDQKEERIGDHMEIYKIIYKIYKINCLEHKLIEPMNTIVNFNS